MPEKKKLKIKCFLCRKKTDDKGLCKNKECGYYQKVNKLVLIKFKPIKPKKQQYIYVARDLKTNGRERAYKKSDVRMVLNSDRYIVNKDFCPEPDESYKPFYGINLKKGEQKRIPLPVDKAVKV